MLIEITPDDRERLAALCHSQWAGWMRYLFEKSEKQPDGRVIIPADAVERWERQVKAPYTELSDKEKDSDRKEADRFIGLLEKRIEEVFAVKVGDKTHQFKRREDAEAFRDKHPGAMMRKISEAKILEIQPFIPKLEGRPDFEVAAAVCWIRSEESKPSETAGWTAAERSNFKTEALREAGKRGLFSGSRK